MDIIVFALFVAVLYLLVDRVKNKVKAFGSEGTTDGSDPAQGPGTDGQNNNDQ
jgi:hypothetical protein